MTVCFMTSELRDTPLFRFTIQREPENGLGKVSQVMVDKIVTVATLKIGTSIGSLSDKEMAELTRLWALWLGLLSGPKVLTAGGQMFQSIKG